MKLNYINGSYNLSFFNMFLETDEDLSQDVIEKYQPTFVHEFIHYLQDLILPYNIRLNLSNVRWFFNILESAHGHGSITRPFNDWSDDSATLKIQLLRSIGGIVDDENDRFISNISEIGNATSDFATISGFDSNLLKYRTHNVYKYYLPVYKSGNSNPICYNLGARDILEYIAYKIEVKHYQYRPPTPYPLPYESIDLLFNKYGLSHVSDDIRLCIAERCLYNDTPIHILLNTFLGNEEFKKYISYHSYEEIYNYLLFSSTVTRDGHIESLTSKTGRRLNQFANELQIQYKCFNEIEKWILRVNNFVESELSERFIFSDMYKMKKDEFHKFIHFTICEIGVPLVMNSNKKYISIQSEEIDISQFIQFYILQNFISFAQSKEKLCPIFDFCKANGGMCNDYCALNPQLRIMKNEDCDYIKFLEVHGLSEIKFN